jgi:dolichol kinase
MAFADIRSEIPRTFFHILGGLFLAWIGYFVDPPVNKIVLGVIFAVTILSEVFRLLVPKVNNLVKILAGSLMRPREEKGLTGAPAFTGGVFIAFLLFHPVVALAALVPLIFGDRAGLLVGKSVGKISFKGKTLEGSLACLAASFLLYMLLAVNWPEVFGYPTIILFFAALIGTLAEALPRPFDDNLTIPLAVGLFLTLVT